MVSSVELPYMPIQNVISAKAQDRQHFVLEFVNGGYSGVRVLRDEGNGKCYDYMTKRTFDSIEKAMQGAGITKATVHTIEKNSFVSPAYDKPNTVPVATTREINLGGGAAAVQTQSDGFMINAEDKAILELIRLARESADAFTEAIKPDMGRSLCADRVYALKNRLFRRLGLASNEIPENAWNLSKKRSHENLYDISSGTEYVISTTATKKIGGNAVEVAQDVTCKEWDDKTVEFIRSLPAGTIITLRFLGTSHAEIDVNKPTHAIFCQGNGIILHDPGGGKIEIVDFNRRISNQPGVYGYDEQKHRNGDVYASFIESFKIVPDSGVYYPDVKNMKPLSEKLQGLTPERVGLDSNATPEKFARAISKATNIGIPYNEAKGVGIPYTSVLAEILNQNGISGEDYNKVPDKKMTVDLYSPGLAPDKYALNE